MTAISQSQSKQFCLALGRKLLAKMSAGRQALKKQQTEKKQTERTHTHTHCLTHSQLHCTHECYQEHLTNTSFKMLLLLSVGHSAADTQ